jgi:hypothetical protein
LTAVIGHLKKPVYRSSFIVKVYSTQGNVPILSSSEMDKLLSELDNLRKENKFNELSRKLGAEFEALEKIDKLYTDIPHDSRDLVEIIIDSYDKNLVTNLKPVIVQYLNQNQYLNERITLLKENNIHLKEEIESKIQGMEAFKNVILTKVKDGRNIYLGFNPLQLDEEIINLKQKVIELENLIKLLKGVEVTVEPDVPFKPIKPQTLKNVAIAGLLSLLGGIFLALFIEWFEKQKLRSK